jgi:cytoskeletal protein CcmA (bactofilin family)
MTRLGRSLVITGELTSDEDVLIEGDMNGHVVLRAATLTIGEHAHIEAELRAARVQVRGTVTGSISATERIELFASAQVVGNLSANHVVIADGAQFGGRVDMDQRTIAARVAQFRAGQPAPTQGASK